MPHDDLLGDDCSCFKCKIRTIQLRPTTAFRPHFSHAVGSYVDTERGFKDTLKRRAEENSIATGLDHQYEMVDPAELSRQPPPASSDDILNTQAKVIRDAVH